MPASGCEGGGGEGGGDSGGNGGGDGGGDGGDGGGDGGGGDGDGDGSGGDGGGDGGGVGPPSPASPTLSVSELFDFALTDFPGLDEWISVEQVARWLDDADSQGSRSGAEAGSTSGAGPSSSEASPSQAGSSSGAGPSGPSAW